MPGPPPGPAPPRIRPGSAHWRRRHSRPRGHGGRGRDRPGRYTAGDAEAGVPSTGSHCIRFWIMRDEGDDPVLDIDPAGTAKVSAGGQQLRSLAGRWRALPQVGELLVFHRADERAAGAKGVALCGEIDTPGALTNVLNFIHLSQWDGSLTVLSGKARKILYYGRGQLLSAVSNVPEERLGALLVRFGMVTQEKLMECVRQVTAQRRLGTVLIEHGVMTAHDLYEGVRRQCEEIFFSSLLLRRGLFYFIKGSDDS